jgi:hypothetical protein
MRRMCLKVLMCIHCPSPALSIFALSPLFLRPTTSERHSIPSSLSKLLGDDDLVCHSSRSKRKVTQLDSLPWPESIRVCQLLALRISRCRAGQVDALPLAVAVAEAGARRELTSPAPGTRVFPRRRGVLHPGRANVSSPFSRPATALADSRSHPFEVSIRVILV